MRLICGLYRLDGAAVSAAVLEAMARGMVAAHLAPAVRVSASGNYGSAVVDFASPATNCRKTSDNGRPVLAADVRLDAPAELARTLGLVDGVDGDGLISAAVARWGAEAPDHILGDFCFAHWDPANRKLLCARDIFGVRPFYYAWRPGAFFAFASFPSGIHAAGLVARNLDGMALARQLVQRQLPGESLFQGIARLPAAHVLEVSQAGLSVHRYWAPDMASAGTRQVGEEAAAAELRWRVEEAVRCRLPRAGTVAAHLSGGLDSSAIAIIAARALRAKGGRLHSWSLLDRQRDDVLLEDETAYVQSVLAQEPDMIWSAIRPLPAAVEQGPFHPDFPLPLGAEEPESAICAAAAAAGAQVILSGWGGDEGATFNGRGVLAELFIRGRWRTLIGEISALKKVRGFPVGNIVRGEIMGFLVPDFLLGMVARLRGGDLSDRMAAILADSIAARLKADPDNRLRLAPDARVNRVRLIGSPHIPHRCDSWAAHGADHGLAFAFPFLDRRVVEYVLSLPSELFARGGWRRRLFRDAMGGILPRLILERHGKATPFPGMALVMAEQKAAIERQVDLLAANAAVRDLINFERLRAEVVALPDSASLKASLHGNATPVAGTAILRQTLRLASYVAQNT